MHAIPSLPALLWSLSGLLSSLVSAEDSLSQKVAGWHLMSERGCVACHEGPGEFKAGPRLEKVGERIQADYLREFIARPHDKKPGTTMPDLLSSYPETEKEAIANHLTAWLLGEQKTALPLQAIDQEAVDRGRALYHEVGCVACHNPEDKTLASSALLPALDEKYSVNSLSTFLEKPLESRPSGRMPDLNLTHWEALDLAHYLLRDQKTPANTSSPAPQNADREKGRAYFEELGCVQCHAPERAATDFGPALSELKVEKPCAKAQDSLSPEERTLIAAALASDSAVSQEESISLKMKQMNCYACHQRGDWGGVSDERDTYFTTSNLNLGEQARIPPSLDGVGAKLKLEALHQILAGEGSVRPYMKTRMPDFGTDNVAELAPWFKAADQAAPLTIAGGEDRQAAVKTGHQLVGDKGLACNSCHTYLGEKSTTLNAIDLTVMWRRLEEDWFHRYMRNPQSYVSQTIMPSFWPDGNSVREEILEGDSEKQIDAIWQYLSREKEARRPSGVRPEPIPYGPDKDEAVMLRRQYNGIGKRGIGVGYPSGINLTFDAGKLSLRSIWKGKFAELSPVWRGQGSGFVKEAGEELTIFPAGPAFAKLNSATDLFPVVPPDENAPNLQLLGYSLDEQQRPTFRYRLGGFVISDFFRDSPEGPHLKRTLSFDTEAPKGLFFRVMEKDQIESTEVESSWMASEKLRVRVLAPAFVVAAGEKEELRVSLEGLKELTLEYHYLD